MNMGERGQIKIGNIFLYTHWEGYAIKKMLQNALAKKWRWDDEEYLRRIIFCEMVKNDIEQETGYGIGDALHTDLNYPLLEVDVKNQEIIEDKKKWSFEKFIKEKFKEE